MPLSPTDGIQLKYQSATPTLVDGQTIQSRCDVNGQMLVSAKLPANSGTDIGDVDVTSVIPGTGATNLGKAVDSAAGATDTVVAPGFVRDDALTTLTPADGDYAPGRVDSIGNMWVSLGTKISGEDQAADVMKVEQQFSSTFISTATTTTSKSGAGRLHSINILKTLAGAVDVYDNTAGSGTKLASFAAGTTPASFMFNCAASIGITTVTASADTVQLNWR